LDNLMNNTDNKYSARFIVVTGIFITCLVISNIIAVKVIRVAGLNLPAAIVIFPISYIFGDILTEVYGYRTARKVIWLGFLCNLFAVLAMWLGGLLPSAPFWGNQDSYQTILGYTPRLLVASFAGYLLGEFTNSFVLAKLKIATKGRWLWTRTIGSTFVGQLLDSGVFILIAFAGNMGWGALGTMVVTHWLVKTGYEALATPFTYMIVGYLKKKEGIDTYDYKTNFNPLLVFPFSLLTRRKASEQE
jgi:uncharacterized integral membrane protein (TIGR00697 family)